MDDIWAINSLVSVSWLYSNDDDDEEDDGLGEFCGNVTATLLLTVVL